jgi:hypothetical protein
MTKRVTIQFTRMIFLLMHWLVRFLTRSNPSGLSSVTTPISPIQPIKPERYINKQKEYSNETEIQQC